MILNCDAKLGKKTIEELSFNDTPVVLEKCNNDIPELASAIVGMKKGEKKTVKIKMKKEDVGEDSEYADKIADFHIEVLEVKQPYDPKEINDDVIKRVGCTDESDLSKKMEEHLKKEYEGLIEAKTKKEMFDLLDEGL